MRDPKRRPATTGGASDSSAGRPRCDDTQPALFTTKVDPGADPHQRSSVRFDIEAGRRARDRGAMDAETASHPGYRIAVRRAIEQLASRGRPFSIDDVRDLAGDPIGTDPNALGGIILGTAREGLITKAGYTQSRREAAHARPVALWVSSR